MPPSFSKNVYYFLCEKNERILILIENSRKLLESSSKLTGNVSSIWSCYLEIRMFMEKIR
jgi:hypothetical protein